MISVYYQGFYELFDKLKSEELYEKTYKNSYFKYLYSLNKEEIKDKDENRTVITYEKDNKIIGILLFKHEIFERKFTHRGIKYKNKELGQLMIYVKPEHREQGIAKKLVIELEKFLNEFINEKESETYIVNIMARQAAFTIAKKYMKQIFVSQQSNVEHIKNVLNFYRIKVHKEHDNSKLMQLDQI